MKAIFTILSAGLKSQAFLKLASMFSIRGWDAVCGSFMALTFAPSLRPLRHLRRDSRVTHGAGLDWPAPTPVAWIETGWKNCIGMRIGTSYRWPRVRLLQRKPGN